MGAIVMGDGYKSVPEGEWIVLEILWRHSEPIPSSTIIEEYREVKDLKDNTIRTYIRRLIDKDMVDFELIGKTTKCLYFAKANEEETRAKQGEHLLKTYFRGNSNKLFFALAQKTDLNERELTDLLTKLDEAKD